MLPPWPPSPPSGPPKGMNFSRRKLVLPRPPLPACTFKRASSTNFMIGPLKQKPRPAPGFGGTVRRPQPTSGALGALGFRQRVHIEALLRAPLLEFDLARHLGKEGVIGADSDVAAGAYRGAALTHENIARQHYFTAEALHAKSLGM